MSNRAFITSKEWTPAWPKASSELFPFPIFGVRIALCVHCVLEQHCHLVQAGPSLWHSLEINCAAIGRSSVFFHCANTMPGPSGRFAVFRYHHTLPFTVLRPVRTENGRVRASVFYVCAE